MRTAMMADITETTVRVEVFEILTQKSNNATKNIIILPTGEKFMNMSRLGGKRTAYDHISKAHGRLKIIAIGSRPNILWQFW
jgi:hypothetical protein